jgi:VCBS repeat-containing protein
MLLAAARRQVGTIAARNAVPAATVTTTAVNSAPVIANVILSVPNSTSGAVTGTVTASDPDADRITYRATTSAKGTVSITTAGVFTYTPTPTARHAAARPGATAAVTTDTVTVTVTDAKGAATSRAVTVPIVPKNSAPTATKTVGAPNTTTGVVTGKITGADADKDPLTYTATAPAKGTLSLTAGTGAFTYTPTPTARHAAARIGAAGGKSDSFTVTVADGYGGSLAVPVTVAVSPANSAPTATATIAKPDPVSGVAKGSVSAADADKDALSYRASAPANGAVSVNADGSFAYTPTAAARTAARTSTTVKTDTFTITVTDGYGGSRAVGVTATIAPANSAPLAGSLTATVNPTTGVVSGTVNAVDPDTDPLTYTAATVSTLKGTATVTAAGAFTYTPTATARHTAARVTATPADKTDTFAVKVTDKYGAATTVAVAVPVAPANAAPVAGVTTVGAADPITRVVTGTVRATDKDNDVLTYTAPGGAPNGSVAVNASSGSFTYTPNVTTTASGDAFTVTVSDGHGGAVAVPVTVTFGGVAQPGLSTFCGCTLMPADSVFHADVTSLAVLAKSATWTTLLGGNLFAAWGGDPWMGNTAGMPVNTVSATRAGEKVVFNRGYSTSGPSIDDSLYAIPDYPLVEGMPSAPAWDRHLLVFQEGTCISQELYNVANGVELPAANLGDALANSIYANTYGSAWIAEAGVRIDMNSALYPAAGWANASRLPYLPLILRPDDLARGSIDHMLGITIAKDRGTGHTWPARAGDGTGTNPDGVPMGTVFRLRADFDISTYAPSTQVVLRALQKHGAVVYDSNSPGQNGATLLAMSNGWTGTGYQRAQQQLRTVPLSAFEAVDVLSLAADPAAGWAIHSTARQA